MAYEDEGEALVMDSAEPNGGGRLLLSKALESDLNSNLHRVRNNSNVLL